MMNLEALFTTLALVTAAGASQVLGEDSWLVSLETLDLAPLREQVSDASDRLQPEPVEGHFWTCNLTVVETQKMVRACGWRDRGASAGQNHP